VFKSFIIGIFSGIALVACLLYFVPAVDQHREASLVSVQPNGGNTESFHVNLPDDRIVAGGAGREVIPANLEWPAMAALGDAQAEVFKIRNRNDVVVGVASRISGTGTATGNVVEWTLHLPARGTLYANLQPLPDAAGNRSGRLRAGTREFASMTGSFNERLQVAADGQEDNSGSGNRIELVTALVREAEGTR
jgi:hypothetical protein